MIVQEGLVTPYEQQFLSSPHHTASEKQQKLYSIVMGLPEDCVSKLKKCLLETSSYDPHQLLYSKLSKVQCDTVTIYRYISTSKST